MADWGSEAGENDANNPFPRGDVKAEIVQLRDAIKDKNPFLNADTKATQIKAKEELNEAQIESDIRTGKQPVVKAILEHIRAWNTGAFHWQGTVKGLRYKDAQLIEQLLHDQGYEVKLGLEKPRQPTEILSAGDNLTVKKALPSH